MNDMTTIVWFGQTKVSIGDTSAGNGNNMELMMERTSESIDDAGRYCFAVLTTEEAEYLANRILDAVEYQRKRRALPPEETETAEYNTEAAEIVNALQRNGGDRKKAAEFLGISERTIYRKMKEYNIEQYKQNEI